MTIIPRWLYEWWNFFGGTEKILPQQFLNRFEEFQTKEQLRLYLGILNYVSILSRKGSIILFIGIFQRFI